MKKTFLLLSLVLFLTSCSVEQKLDQVKKEAEEENNEFVEANKNATPEEAINTKYDELVAQYGGPDEYFTLYNVRDPNWEESFYVSDKLGVDYEKLSYIQQQSGTYGVRALLQAMKSDEKVDATLEVFNNFLEATDGDISYFKERMPEGLSPQDEAEFIAQEIVNAYLYFYKLENVQVYNQVFVDSYAEISALNKENLEAVDAWWDLEFYTKLLPDELEYKAELQTLLDSRYQ